jgi:hypothetical protein
MSMELAAKNEELQQVVAERDLAKMQLYKVGRELGELKEANQDLGRQLADGQAEARQRQRRLEKAETRLQSLETNSSCAGLLSESAKLKAKSVQDGTLSSRESAWPESDSTSQKSRRKIDAAHHNVKASKGSSECYELSSQAASGDVEQQRIDAVEERLALIEQHGFIGRGPLPELVGNLKPCKPPLRARTPKEFELGLPEKYHAKSLRSRSMGGVKGAYPTQMSSMSADLDRSVMSRGPSSQLIAYGDRDLPEMEVGNYLSRSNLGERSRCGF